MFRVSLLPLCHTSAVRSAACERDVFATRARTLARWLIVTPESRLLKVSWECYVPLGAQVPSLSALHRMRRITTHRESVRFPRSRRSPLCLEQPRIGFARQPLLVLPRASPLAPPLAPPLAARGRAAPEPAAARDRP